MKYSRKIVSGVVREAMLAAAVEGNSHRHLTPEQAVEAAVKRLVQDDWAYADMFKPELSIVHNDRPYEAAP